MQRVYLFDRMDTLIRSLLVLGTGLVGTLAGHLVAIDRERQEKS